MRIALAGNGLLAGCLMRGLLDSTHKIVAIVQNGRETRGIWRRVMPWLGQLREQDYMPAKALRHRLPIIWIDKMTEAELAPLRALAPDILLVGGFGVILKRPILDLPRIGCVNTHSSLLPKHRGPNPFSAAILAGDAETGVTFHCMDEGIDTGDILAQYPFPITPAERLFSLYRRASEMAGVKVAEVMDRIEAEGLQGTPQNHALATYEKKRTIEDTWMDWTQPAEYLERMVRGMSPSPMPRFWYRGQVVRVANAVHDPAPVDAAPGTVLEKGPPARVATGLGTLQVRVAYVSSPLPWIWPSPWLHPEPGESLLPENQEREIVL